jgi:hypothetical protein
MEIEKGRAFQHGLFCFRSSRLRLVGVEASDADGAFENFYGCAADARNQFLSRL